MEDIENEYFPEIQLGNVYGDSENYGILNVSLTKSKNVVTGYVWKYTFYNTDGKLKVLSSYDLIKLRRMAEKYNQKWIIIDLNKAKETYDFNRSLQKKHKSLKKKYVSTKISASGVKYVYRNKDSRCKSKGYYWCYRGGNKSYSSKRLTDLYLQVKELDLPWIVMDKDLFESILEKEKKCLN